jgi:Meckel syndrome type 1 protein
MAQATSRDGATPDALAAKAALRASTLAAEGAKPTDPAILLARAITAATAAQEAGQETPQLAAPVLGVAAKLVGLSAPQPPVSDVQDEVPQGQTPWLTPMDSAPRPADAPVPSQAARGESAPPTPTRQLAPVLVSMALGRGSDTLTISLDPIELGRVEVSISQGKEAGQVRIVAERPETLALLQRDQRELDRALSQAGLGELGRSIAFSLSSDQGRQQHQGWGQEKAQRSTGLVISAEGDRGLAMVPTQNRASTSLIDLAV